MEGFLLDPSHPTIATIAQGNGFATAAFVGARVLAKSFGLAHGFGHYDDDMGSQPDDEDLTGTVAERRAGVVTQRALDWLQGNRGKRFFLWTHYFDPHAPYDPPEPYKRTYARDAYSGEIAYMDQEVGRLFEGLRQMGLEDQTLVAVLGDHGESLGEHGEMTHGVFLYDSTMRVPFLLAGPGVPHGKVIQEQVRSIDVMPTLLAFLNLAPGPEAQGISLWPRIEKELRLPSLSYSYGETLYPRTYMGWSELRAMRTDSWKLIVAPHPELYDLEQDPGEAHNLFAESPGEAARLRKKLLEVAGDFSRPQKVSVKPVDEKTLRDLQSLGYVGAGPRREIALGTKAPDPKDRAAVLKIFGQVEDLLNKKQYAPAARAAEQALRLDPTNPRAHLYLATAYEQMLQYPRAVEVLQHAADAGIDAERIYSRLGIDYLHLQRMDQAVAALERAARLNPMDLRNLLNLGMAYLQQNRPQDAERTFRAIIAQNGRYAPAHNGLGIVAAQRGDAEGARREFQSAME
ncbi:MAG TPA: sulfatase-like hydrolase/transferase, partial [Bryobacteraceae bacterium]|nr:sulfatase-like hydrolase/transferase [Bryobacteraceae bacterium]